MLSEEQKKNLCEKLLSVVRGNDSLSEDDLKRMIDVFDNSLEIEPVANVELVPRHIYNAIERFLDGGIERSAECVKEINQIEPYAKHIMYIARPKLLEKGPERKWDTTHSNKCKNWELKDVYVEGLNLVSENTRLKREGEMVISALENNPNATIAFPEGYYLIAYTARNEEAHAAIKREFYLAYKVVLCVIMAYLLIADKYSSVIETQYEYIKIQRSMNLNDYLGGVVSEKQKKLERYVPLSWIAYPKGKDDKLLLPDRLDQLPQKQIKVVGAAGSGKTFFLEKIECMYAQRYFKSEKKTHVIPIYLRLIDLLINNTNSIEELFSVKTGIPIELADEYMCNHSIMLLLDGYDEISDQSLKRKAAVKIDYLIANGANIIVTDREMNSKTLSDKLSCYIPQKMEPQNYKQLIEKYSQSEIIKEGLLKKLDDTPDYFDDNYNTPFKLVTLIEVCEYNNTILEEQNNLTDLYIQYLFDRESQQKKNPLTKALQRLLAGLALEGDSDFSEAKILSVFATWKTKLGFDCDTDACLTLAVQLGIIVYDESNVKYSFFNDEFFVSFLVLAEKLGLTEI